MGTGGETNSDPERPGAADAGTEAAGDSNAPDQGMRQWAREHEERAREVAAQVARGELEGWIEQLLGDDEHQRYDLARDIARGGQAVIPRVIELAEDERPRMREMACYILGQVGYPNPDDSGWLIRYPDGIPALIRRPLIDAEQPSRGRPRWLR